MRWCSARRLCAGMPAEGACAELLSDGRFDPRMFAQLEEFER